MYLHAGNNKIIRTKSIIGIFDMDNATMGADTRAFLQHAQKDGTLEISKTEIPKPRGRGHQDPQIIFVNLVKLGKGQGIDAGTHFNGVTGPTENLDEPVLVAGVAGNFCRFC